jgi:hypothetical protein
MSTPEILLVPTVSQGIFCLSLNLISGAVIVNIDQNWKESVTDKQISVVEPLSEQGLFASLQV